MGQAKEIRVAPIAKRDTRAPILRVHYRHKRTRCIAFRYSSCVVVIIVGFASRSVISFQLSRVCVARYFYNQFGVLPFFDIVLCFWQPM